MKKILEMIQDNIIPSYRFHLNYGVGQSDHWQKVLCGSFNPIHEGHVELLDAANKAYGRAGYLELSLRNCTKDSISIKEAEKRITTIHKIAPSLGVIVTNAPYFVQKSAILPFSSFIVGYDTAERFLANTSFWELDTISLNRCKFMVSGRTINGIYKTIKDLNIPEGAEDMFIELDYHNDISSTEIRNDSKISN